MDRELHKIKSEMLGGSEQSEEEQDSGTTSVQHAQTYVDPIIVRFLADSELHLRGYN